MSAIVRTAAAAIAFTIAGAAAAAPTLTTTDAYLANAWTPPTMCSNTSLAPTCVAATTNILAPVPGVRLLRGDTAPAAFGFTRAFGYVNGVLGVGVEGGGPLDLRARTRYFDTLVYTGPATASFVVPFNITRFSLGVNAPTGDTRTASLGFSIRVDNAVRSNVAFSTSVNANGNPLDETVPPLIPAPVANTTFPPGFFAFSSVTTPDSATAAGGPGGPVLVDLGAFTTGQIFTLDYRMFARSTGLLPGGSGFALIGDPFEIPGAGIDFGGLAISIDIPAPAALALFGLGVLGLLALCRR